jgi:hypothetical protein
MSDIYRNLLLTGISKLDNSLAVVVPAAFTGVSEELIVVVAPVVTFITP